MSFQHFHYKIKRILFLSVFVWAGLLCNDAICAENISEDKTLTNSLGMKFMLILPGKFMMGSKLSPTEIKDKYGGDARWYSDESPQHEVTITRPYYIQTTEVTQGQWKAVMSAAARHCMSYGVLRMMGC